MRDLNDAIADVETDIGQVQAQLAARGDQCRELIKEQEALHGRVRDDFNALARLQAAGVAGASTAGGGGVGGGVRRPPTPCLGLPVSPRPQCR